MNIVPYSLIDIIGICRFGEVADVATLADGSITVRFKERRDAESAKTRGAFYNSGVLLMDWLEAEESGDV